MLLTDDAPTDTGPAGGPEPITDRIEVRLLGPLRVRRSDGSLVDAQEWRTGKTADLVRLLALRCGQPVPVDTLLDALWPHADPQRGRASLRTAASQIRRILGPDCLCRRIGGLELRDVWVDVSTFTSLAREVRRLADDGQAAAAVTAAREADALYLDDFRAHGDAEDWALQARADLARTRLQLICDAADAAVSLGWMRDAVEFAGRAVALDRYSEQAYRALMRGYAGLGQTSRSLLEFERCRRFLAEELGVDPSPQTRAVHLQLLTATPPAPTTPPFVGRRDEVNQLKMIFEASTASRRTTVLTIAGAPGVGKSRTVVEACREVAADLAVASCKPVAGRPRDCLAVLEAALRDRAADDDGSHVVVLDDADLAKDGSVQRLVDARQGRRGALTIVLTGRAFARLVPPAPAPGMRRMHHIELTGLPAEDVGELAGKLLCGDVAPDLVRALLEDSDGLPEKVAATVRGWSREGRVAATAGGLVLTDRAGIHTTEPATKRIAPLLEQLDSEDLKVLLLLAVLSRPSDPAMIAPLMSETGDRPGIEPPRSRVQGSLDRLVDLCVVVTQPAGYVFRDPLLRDSLESWMRPTARRDLHRRVAERGFIPTAERVEHWLKAGETQLGRSAAVAAAEEAMADSRYEDARTHLMQVCSLGPMPETVPRDRVELFERLGDVCAVLGRRHEARAAFSVALSVSRAHSPADVARVAAKRDKVSESDWLHETAVGVQTPAPARVDEREDPAHIGSDGPALEQRLRESLELADRLSDPDPRAEARLRLTTAVCLPQRKFRLGGLWAQEALAMTVAPGLRARALVASWLPGVLFGEAQLAEQPLEQAAELAERAADASLLRRVRVLQCLVAHDLGRPDSDQRWDAASSACAPKPDANWAWVRIRVAAERGDLASAQAADRAPALPGTGPLARQMRAIASATLSAELGDVRRAVRLLESVVQTHRREGWTLLLPEAFALLIMLRSADAPATARADFDALDASVGGDHGFPREQCLRLLARGAIRSASGQHERAAAAADNARDVAARSGLPALATVAERALTQHRTQARRCPDTGRDNGASRPVPRVRSAIGLA